MECFAPNCICCLLSLSVNGTQLDRVVLINEGSRETRSWTLYGMECRTKGSSARQGQGEIMYEPSNAKWNIHSNNVY